MISKRKIVAIVSFILMGFIMFTFANPSDGIDSLTTPIEKEQPVVKPVDNDKNKDKVITVNPQVVVDNAPVITVDPAIVKIVEGTEYDVKTGVTVTDDKDTNLVINTSITSITEVGEYEVTYTVTDSANHTVTAKRKIVILSMNDDEDEDGYTNKEEFDNDSDFDDEDSTPVDNAPEIEIEPKEVTIEFGKKYDLMTGVKIEDDFDSIKNKKIVVELDIEDTTTLMVGEYTVTYTITDRKGNVTTETRKVIVEDKVLPIITVKTGKTETIGSITDKVYSQVSFTLYDNASVGKIYLNGILIQNLSMGKWSDADFITINTIGAKEGLNKFTLVDIAGNSTDYEFTLDSTAPTITVKDKSVRVNNLEDTYTNVSFKLFDTNKVNSIIINGYTKEITAVNDLDLNDVAVGNNYGVLGKNSITLYDVAGNSTTYNFTLKKILKEENLKDVVFEDKVFNYNGKQHNLVATNLPDWVTVEYVNNAKVNIQEAIVTAKITAKLDSDYAGTVKLTAKLTIKDLESPLMTLNGESSLTLRMGIDSYEELGALVTDNVDATITNLNPIAINYYVDPSNTANQKLVDKVDTNVIGTYKLVYIYKDKAKNQALDKNNIKNDYIIRIVKVVDRTAPVITGIEEGATYVNTVSYEVADKYLTKINVDGVDYTVDNAPYTITEEGSHTVTAVDSSNNSTSVTFTIERRYSVTFKDYNGNVILTKSVVRDGDATALAPNMVGKTYTSKGITYTFINWDKNLNNINENTEVTAVYDIAKIMASVYSLNEGLDRPVNGDCSLGGTKDYTKLGTAQLVLTDPIKTITKNNTKKVLTSNIDEVLANISDLKVLPFPTDSEENFTKYEWYTLKYENDGWHIDGQKVSDIAKLDEYIENAIKEIKNYASNIEYNDDLLEITNIINASGINALNTKTAIDKAVTDAKALIDGLLTSLKEQAKKEVEAANVGFNDSYKAAANEIVSKGDLNITNATTVSGVNGAKNNAINELNNLRALMNQTFNVSLTNGKNNVLISNIASDVIITKVIYTYSVWSDNEVYTGSSNQTSLTINYSLDEGYKDVNNVIIKYTKNGKYYEAKYKVDYEYEWLDGYIPSSIEQISNNYKA